ncbi:hypothetical protein [Scytonema sp. PCC 10023]
MKIHIKVKDFTHTIIDQDIEAVESQKPLRLPLDLQAEYHLPSVDA